MGGLQLTPVAVPCRCGDTTASLGIRVIGDPTRTVLGLSGELDSFGGAQLDDWLIGDVVLDMEAVTFIDSQGVRTIVRANRDANITIRNPSRQVRRVLEICGLLDLVE